MHAVHDTHGNDLMTTISGHYSAIDASCCKNRLAGYTIERLPHSITDLEGKCSIIYGISSVLLKKQSHLYGHRDFAK